jgi:hypothetical protein
MVDGKRNDRGSHSLRVGRHLSHGLAQASECDRFLGRSHECCLLWGCIRRDRIAKGIDRDPKQSIFVRLKLWRLRVRSYAAKNLAYRLAFVRHNRSNVDQRLHLRIAGRRSGNDRAATGVTHEHHGSVCLCNTRRSVVTSSLRDVNGSCAATTLKPRRCNSIVTLFQLEPSAQAACTKTAVKFRCGFDLILHFSLS